eukprot:14174678-Heterocapsa_arctica.AAC.1
MFKCRLSLNRGVGPPDKAPGVRLEDIVSDAEVMRGKEEFDAMYPFASFVVAHRWLQREIENSASRLAH